MRPGDTPIRTLIRQFITIGEAVKHLTARRPGIKWRKIAGLRYIIQTKLNPLEEAVAAMIMDEGA